MTHGSSGILLLILAVVALFLIGYAGWIAFGIAVLFGVAGTSLLWNKRGAFPELTFICAVAAAALIPHLVFLVAYNFSMQAAAAVNGIKPEPQLVGLALAYENFVADANDWFEANLGGSHAWLIAAIILVLIIAATFWKLRAAETVVAVRRVLVGVQVFLIIAASFTILSNAEVGSWTPDFRLKVQARTDKLASIRAENLLLQQVPPAVHDSAGSIRNTYGTALTLIENNSSNMRPLSGGAGSPTNVSVLAVLAEKRGFPSHILEMSDTKPVRAEAILRDEQQKASASVVRTASGSRS